MVYYTYRPVAVLTYCFMASVAFSFPAQAKTTFLPDFEEEPMIFPGDCEGGGEDYCLCQRSTNPVYHLVQFFPKCSSPKIFDKTCPHSDDWITECYCPATYNKICTSPYRGVGEICDGKYESCCDTRCREGSTSGCSYPYVLDYTSSTGCGETCYVCRYGNDCNTSCSADEITSPSGGYNDFNGQACVSCSTPPPPEPECTPYGDESGCNCYSCSDGCGGTRQCCSSCYTPSPAPEPTPEPTPTPDPEPEKPSCTDTCSSKGYKSSQPGGQTCSTTTVCGSTCYYNCKSSCTDTCSSKGYKSAQPSGQTCSTITVCGTTCYKDCKSSCTDTCSSKGYKSSQPSGQTCSTTTVCGSTCYYNCKSNDPCAGVTCSGGKTCSNGTCVCPSGKKRLRRKL